MVDESKRICADNADTNAKEEVKVEHFKQRICRLCASNLSVSTPSDTARKWFPLTGKTLVTPCDDDDEEDTVFSLITKCLPKTILINLPNEATPENICLECCKSLQQMREFFLTVANGQQQLLSKLKASGYGLPEPRKRGRPRKQEQAATPQEALPVSMEVEEGEPRAKRSSRAPARYSSEYKDSRKESIAPGEDTRKDKPESTSASANKNSSRTENERKESEVAVAVHVESENLKDEADTDNDDCEVRTSENDLYTRSGRKPKRNRKKRGRPPQQVKRNEFTCDKCTDGPVYNCQQSLLYHQLSVHGDKIDFQCPICKETFLHKGLLANHMFLHEKESNFTCGQPNCKSSFASVGGLQNHMKTKHVEGKRFICEICGTSFTLSSSLKTHARLHTGERPFSCHFCPKAFNHRGNLKEHLRSHTREKPYACNEKDCTKRYSTSSQLRSHKLTHAESHPFLCNECGKGFSHRATFMYHLKRHKGQKPPSLKKNSRSHTGKKPYKCEICKKTFLDASNYAKHKKIHPPVANETVDVAGSSASSLPHVPDQNTVVLESSGNPGDEISEPLIQILSPVTFESLKASTAECNGSIVYIYHAEANDLFSTSVDVVE